MKHRLEFLFNGKKLIENKIIFTKPPNKGKFKLVQIPMGEKK